MTTRNLISELKQRIYPKPPEVMDRNERGTQYGERREVISYVCKRAGQVVIPAVAFTWWDLDDRQLRTHTFPARTIEIAPNPAMLETGETTEPAARPLGKILKIAAIAAAALLALVALLCLPSVRAGLYRAIEPFRARRLQPLNPDKLSTPHTPCYPRLAGRA